MQIFKATITITLILAAGLGLAEAQQGKSQEVLTEFFEQRVRPVFVKNCYGCHADSQLGGLRLDSRAGLLRGGNSGAAIVPGKPAESLLIQAIDGTHARFKMPLGSKLSPQQIADLSAWVRDGAVWPEAKPATEPSGVASIPPIKADANVIPPAQRAFWSYQPIHSRTIPKAPKVKEAGWAKTALDRFILAKLEEKGLQPARPADRRTLLRRVTFDLIGLPPTPEEVEAFVNDKAPNAFAKVVDRLLASPHYGERWGRHWLDLARYVDIDKYPGQDIAENAWRYRDWVIRAFNEDLPYDQFVRAQIAADFLPAGEREKHLPALAFQSLARSANDQVDVTTKVFLGLTVGCAQCHNHKYDPIPTQDYYSLLGVFQSSKRYEHPLADESIVKEWQRQQQQIDERSASLRAFVKKQSEQLSEILAAKTSQYLLAAWQVLGPARQEMKDAAQERKLDEEILKRLVAYLREPNKDHRALSGWSELLSSGTKPEDVEKFAADFQTKLLAVIAEKRAIEERNFVMLGGTEGLKNNEKVQYTNLEFLAVEKFYLWRDFCSEPFKVEGRPFSGGVFFFGEKELVRFLTPLENEHIEVRRAEIEALKKAQPAKYPFLSIIRDADKVANAKVAIRGDESNPGEEAPRRFLRILCDGEPPPFAQGSGRWELAEAIASPKNPLTARVMVNRVWAWHFGAGLVRTPSNFGLLGERPSHPELLDYLAARFIAQGWSLKSLHREILLSSTYQMSSEYSATKAEADADNRLLWRFPLKPRLEIEAIRDAMLAVSGTLDRTVGGPSSPWKDELKRRTMYVELDREEIVPTLKLFDFPEAALTAEQRMVTNGPLQRLFFMNSLFVQQQATALAARLDKNGKAGGDAEKIGQAYQLLFNRPPKSEEVQLGLGFLQSSNQAWNQYLQVLLSSNEFVSVR